MLKCMEHLDSIYVACGPTDLRKNVDGLSILVKQSFGLDPFSKSLFLFCNGSRNRLKALVWDKNGFIMLYKRLDGAGARFSWPADPVQVRKYIQTANGPASAWLLYRSAKRIFGVFRSRFLLKKWCVNIAKNI